MSVNGDAITPSQALQVVPSEPLANSWNSAELVQQRVQLVQQVYRGIMKQDTHFGVVPGCQKPSLWKAGSEQLLMTFKLAVQPEVEDLSTEDEARYRVTCHITHAPTGQYLGSGIGECSSNELKYKWRAATCIEEFEATDASRKRVLWKKGQRGAYAVQQVRQEVADVANTVLKMAKKRAQIDATLTVTAASDIFTQDIEDMETPITDHEDATQPQPTQPATVQMPQRKSAPAQPKQDPMEITGEDVARVIHGASNGNAVCPSCGEKLEADGCHFCGWVPEAPEPQPAPQPVQQRPTVADAFGGAARRQAPPAQRPEPPKHQAPPAQSARNQGGPVITDAQSRRFFAICMGNGITKPEMNKYLSDRFGITDSRQIPKADYEEACAWAQGN